MLVMSESRLKIQITSGAEIRTNDQDTPFTDWCNLVIMAPTNPVLALVLCNSSSSSRDFLRNRYQQRKGLDTNHFEIQIPLLTEALPHMFSDLDLASWLDIVAGQELESLVHQDDRKWHLQHHHPLRPWQRTYLEYHLKTQTEGMVDI